MGENRSIKRRRISFIGGAAGATLALASCGGIAGSSSSSSPTLTTAASTRKALYLTDDFSGEYEAVWVTVSRITAVQGSVETDLATFSPAQVVNLPQLKRSGLFVGNTSIPAGTTAFRVYVGSQAQIRGLDGTFRTVQLATSGGYIEFNGTTWVSSSGVVALDFDLPKFVLTGDVLTPATRIADTNDQSQWTSRYGELKGKVVAVSASDLTLLLNDGTQVSIVIDANTTYRSSNSATWTPAVGQQVEVDVLLGGTLTAPTYTARSIHDEGLFNSTGTGSRPEVEGTIVSVSGSTIVIDIVRSEDIALIGRITLDTTGAIFKRGSASLLAAGVRIEGHVSRTTTLPSFVSIEIEGAAKTEALSSTATTIVKQGHADIKASVTAVNGTQIDLRILKLDGLSGYTVGQAITIDTASAYFSKGSLGCLVAGSPIEVDGYLDGANKFVVVKVELEGACGAGLSSGTAATAGQLSEASGLVQTVGTGQLTLLLFQTESWVGTPLATVTVTFDATTTFEDVESATLAPGQFIKVKGVVSSNVLAARKIARD